MAEEVATMMVKKEEESVLAILREACERFPRRTALIYLGETLSYAKLKELIDRFATALTDLGVKKKDKVIIYLSNTPQFVIAFYAIMEIGAVPVPISPIYTPFELRYMSQDCGAETIICQDTNFGYVKEVMAQSPLKRIIYTGLADMLPWWKKAIGFGFDTVPRGRIEKGEGVYHFTNLLKYPPKQQKVEAKTWEDICRILYTGGTTGLPKGGTILPCSFILWCKRPDGSSPGNSYYRGPLPDYPIAPSVPCIMSGCIKWFHFGFRQHGYIDASTGGGRHFRMHTKV